MFVSGLNGFGAAAEETPAGPDLARSIVPRKRALSLNARAVKMSVTTVPFGTWSKSGLNADARTEKSRSKNPLPLTSAIFAPFAAETEISETVPAFGYVVLILSVPRLMSVNARVRHSNPSLFGPLPTVLTTAATPEGWITETAMKSWTLAPVVCELLNTGEPLSVTVSVTI